MLKMIISVLLIAIGLYTIGFWIVGSHGHMRLRPHMLEDWVMTGILIISFGIPLFFLIQKNYPNT